MPLPSMRQKTRPKGFIGTIKPDADIAKANWEQETGDTTDIFESIDDDVSSTFIRTDEITMAFCGGSEEDRTCRFDMEAPATAPSGAEQINVRVRARYNSSGSNPAIVMTVRLYEVSTLRATKATDNLTGSIILYPWILSQAQKDAVGNWNNVRIDVAMSICEDDGDPIRGEIEEEDIVFV